MKGINKVYLRVYKCFTYKKILKFTHRALTYRRHSSSTLTDVDYRINWLKERSKTRVRKVQYLDENNRLFGCSTEIVSELNGIYCSLINYYSTRCLDK